MVFGKVQAENIQIKGYQPCLFKQIVTWCFICVSLGLLGLILFWRYDWYIKCTHSICSLKDCTKVLVLDGYGKLYVEKVIELSDDKKWADKLMTSNHLIPSIHNSVKDPQECYFEVPLSNSPYFALQQTVKLFQNKNSTYLYSTQTGSFYSVRAWLCQGLPVKHMMRFIKVEGASNDNKTAANTLTPRNIDSLNQIFPGPPTNSLQRIKRLLIFGQNDLYIPVPGFFKTMQEEVVTPFYAFQAFSVILWYFDDYWFYASCALIISVLTLLKSTFDIRKERVKMSQRLSSTTNTIYGSKINTKINNKVSNNTNELEQTVFVERYEPENDRCNGLETCFVSQIVPGDIIHITMGVCNLSTTHANKTFSVPCDAVILEGSCVVDECMLTGESFPIVKTALNLCEHLCTAHENRNLGLTGTIHGTPADPNIPMDSKLLFFEKDPSLTRNVIYKGTSILQISSQEESAECLDNRIDQFNRNILPLSGYNICRQPFLRVYVLATGFNTAKGKMVIDFLYPAPSPFRFDQDSVKFLFALSCVSLIGVVYSVTLKISHQEPLGEIVIRSLLLISIVVPAALPAAITIGLMYAQKRLKREHGVLCLSPDKINVSGALDVMCFDKTGTLTEEGLDVIGVMPLVNFNPANIDEFSQNMSEGKTKASSLPPTLPFFDETLADFNTNKHTIPGKVFTSFNQLSICCALCHSLVKMSDGEFMGDPLEIKMFKASGWTFYDDSLQSIGNTAYPNSQTVDVIDDNYTKGHEIPNFPLRQSIKKFNYAVILPPGYNPHLNLLNDFNIQSEVISSEVYSIDETVNPYVIVHKFFFIPSLQRMSVIVKKCILGSRFELYAKGSPEVIHSLCRSETLPINFKFKLDELTNDGCRVIACARRTLELFDLKTLNKNLRKDLEKDLDFLGFLIFQNKLTPQSQPTIDTLNDAGFKNVMITGDNLLTAIAVASKGHLIPAPVKMIYIVEASFKTARGSPNTGNVISSPDCLVINLTPKSLLNINMYYAEDLLTNSTLKIDLGTEKELELDIKVSSSTSFFRGLYKIIYDFKCCISNCENDKPIKDSNLINSSPFKRNNFKAKSRTISIFESHNVLKRIRNYFAITPNIQSSSHACNNISSQALKNDEFWNYSCDKSIQITPCNSAVELNPFLKNTEQQSYHDVYYAMTGSTFEILDKYNAGVSNDVRVNEIKIYISSAPSQFTSNNCLSRLVYHKIYKTDFVDNTSINKRPLNKCQQTPPLKIGIDSDGTSQVSLLSTKFLPFSPYKTKLGRPTVIPDDCHYIKPTDTFDILDSILVDRCSVFARMSPEAKTRLINKFQKLDYFVGMCGDGANDCGALKAAHMGVSLASRSTVASGRETNLKVGEEVVRSRKIKLRFNKLFRNIFPTRRFGKTRSIKNQATLNERECHFAARTEETASLAASFTATHGDISCLPAIIREGRASLTTSFGVFKNMACYSLNQFVACLLLYWYGTSFSDVQFTFVDLFPATILIMLVGNTRAYPTLPNINETSFREVSSDNDGTPVESYQSRLEKRIEQFTETKPDTSLILSRHVGSVIGHILINILFMWLALSQTLKQPWCKRELHPVLDTKNPLYPHLAGALFFITCYQYINFTIIFSRGPPFRRSFVKNIPLLVITLVCIAFCTYLILREPLTYPVISQFFAIRFPPTSSHINYYYLALAFINFLVSLSFEKVLLDRLLSTFSRKRDLLLRPIKRPAHLSLQTFTQRLGLGTVPSSYQKNLD